MTQRIPPEYLCKGCMGDMRFAAEIHRHNIACGTNGERAYPNFPVPIFKSRLEKLEMSNGRR